MSEQTKPVLVIGGGMSGVTAATEIAETGREVILLEELPYLGGQVIRMNNYFPKLCPPACGMEINFRRIRQNSRITVIPEAKLESLGGEKGNFRAVILKVPRYVNDRCTACGLCTEVCPVQIPDTFNAGFSLTKAIHLPHAMAYPMKYHIDGPSCLRDNCAKCVEVCSYGAIDLAAKEERIETEVSSVIYATGWHSYDAGKIPELKYNESADIVSNTEFERLLATAGSEKGKLLRPSDGKPVKEVVFVQCAGSRDENHLPYCSAVCCTASMKHALNVVNLDKDSHCTICYIDLRVSGRNEDFLKKVETHERISLKRGKVAKIICGKENLEAVAEDSLSGKRITYTADLIVLATGLVPNTEQIGLQKNDYGFVTEDDGAGIFATGCTRKPLDVSASVKDVTAKVMKTLQIN